MIQSLPPSLPLRIRLRFAIALLVVASILGGLLAPRPAVAQTAAGPGPTAADLYAPVVDGQRDGIYDQTAGALTGYAIDARFNPASDDALGTIAGGLELAYVNDTGEPQPDLFFRLYPNADEYADGAMTIDRVVAGNNEVETELREEETLARVTLPEPLAADARIDLRVDFTTTIPTDPERSYGMFSLDAGSGTYALAHWLPLLAGYDPINGWVTGPLSVYGDPVFTNAALFDVTITAPAEYVFVTTGNEVESAPAEAGTAPPSLRLRPGARLRDGRRRRFPARQPPVGETTVNSYFNPGHDAGAAEVLTYGSQALEVFNRLFGHYPYAEMDLVEVDLGNGAGGVEFPQLMFIGDATTATADRHASSPATSSSSSPTRSPTSGGTASSATTSTGTPSSTRA